MSRRRCRTGWVSEGLPETLPHHFRYRLAFMVSYPTNPQPTPRCSACQLQLCKGRDAPPHAALTLTEGAAEAQRLGHSLPLRGLLGGDDPFARSIAVGLASAPLNCGLGDRRLDPHPGTSPQRPRRGCSASRRRARATQFNWPLLCPSTLSGIREEASTPTPTKCSGLVIPICARGVRKIQKRGLYLHL